MNWSRVARRIRVPLSFAFAAVYLWLAQPTWRAIALGGGIALAGVLLRALASGHVRKNDELTMTGPYAYTRNPLYLGSVIIAAGFAVAARSWWVLLGMAAIFLAVYVPVIRAEEAYLRRRFGEFNEYARRVPRLLPRLTHPRTRKSGAFWGPRLRASRVTASGFSRELYCKHREYNAAIGTLAMLAALAAKLWLRR